MHATLQNYRSIPSKTMANKNQHAMILSIKHILRKKEFSVSNTMDKFLQIHYVTIDFKILQNRTATIGQ